MAAAGAVPIQDICGGDESAGSEGWLAGPRPISMGLALFFIIIFTDTDMFVHDFLGPFRNTLSPNGVPNGWGSVVRAVFILLMFGLAVTLIKNGVI